MPETPAARPSMLSRRFNAVESATSHRMANSVDPDDADHRQPSPKDTATVAMTSWAVLRLRAERRSSSRPRRRTRPRRSRDRRAAAPDVLPGGARRRRRRRWLGRPSAEPTPVPAIAPRPGDEPEPMPAARTGTSPLP
jgi:hypothetical protein